MQQGTSVFCCLKSRGAAFVFIYESYVWHFFPKQSRFIYIKQYMGLYRALAINFEVFSEYVTAPEVSTDAASRTILLLCSDCRIFKLFNWPSHCWNPPLTCSSSGTVKGTYDRFAFSKIITPVRGTRFWLPSSMHII